MSDGWSRTKKATIAFGILVVGFYGSFYALPHGFHPCDDLSQPYLGASFGVTVQDNGDIRISHQGGREINSSNTYRLYLYLEDNETGKSAEYTWWNESAPRGVEAVARNDTVTVNYERLMGETRSPGDRVLLFWEGPGNPRPVVCPTNYDTERAPLADL